MKVKKTTAVISGFGGGYEDTCQRMLWKGVAYLAEVQPPLDIWKGVHSYEGVYGVLVTKGAGIKALEAAATAGEDDITGAIHQAVMGHLRAIHEHGVDWWIGHLRNHDPSRDDRIFEWEGELFPNGGAP
jgi:hypothetical protein